ncbi:MAG: PIN domain-containing protein, partial [Prochlorotrichaceae cyanobacterium]
EEQKIVNKSLLDTDIFSEILKAKNLNVLQNAIQYRQTFGCYSLSVITIMEITTGWQKRQQEQKIKTLIKTITQEEVIPVSLDIAILAGQLYADLETTGQRIGYPDCIIAATALTNDLVLVTGNLRHYSRIFNLNYNLRLENWRS